MTPKKWSYFFLNLPRSYHKLIGHMTSFQTPFLENMWVVLYNKGYQMIEVIELIILLQLIQVLTQGLNSIFYEDQKEVGVRTSISHK